MVQLANSGNLGADSEAPHPSKAKVKLEIEDPLDEEHGPLSKRSKNSAPHQEQWSTGISNISSRPTHYNPLDEPSPLGLRLRKSPSLLELIQMKLSQGSTAVTGVTKGENLNLGKKDTKGNSAAATSDKLKASNFPVSILRIGSWKCVSRYEGDLVAKCYFAKHKLVWEVLDGGLKSKIEIQWSDIMGLRATYPDNEPGTLDVVLARQPLFFRETNPQPRKHTLWQATSDFTGGQASLHRRHFLQCPPGLLNKHFEKLIVCDPRLNMLSQQPEIVLDSPYFEPRNAVFDDQDESKCHSFDHLKSDYVSTFAGLQDAPSPSAAQSSSSMSELRDPVGVTEVMPRGIPSPSSVMDTRAMEENASSEAEGSKLPSQWDQFKVPGLHPSMSMSDLVTHIGNCISEQMTSGDPLLVEEGSRSKDMLEELTQYLLSDSHFSSGSDEQRLMSRVNSLCCLIQRDVSTAQNSQVKTEACIGIMDSRSDEPNTSSRSPCELKAGDFSASGGEASDMSGCRQPPAMSRKDSVGDLLLHLPRIASLPQFLFNIAEDVDSKAR